MRSLKMRLLFFLLMPVTGFAQTQPPVSKELKPDEFFAIVKKYHPVIKQADIQVKLSENNIMAARGAFDPSLYLDKDQKTFDGKNYFGHQDAGIKIPTWYGVELKAGFENNGGALLQSEKTAGESSYMGISIPLARNLLIDKRRAMLQQSKIFLQQSTAERENMINNILYEAGQAYWNWVNNYQSNEIMKEIVAINRQRFELVKIGFRQGDRPAIDTIEALAQCQYFEGKQTETEVQLQQAMIELSGYLWLEENVFYNLSENTIPGKTATEAVIAREEMPNLDDLISQSKINHPLLRSYNFKQSALLVDKKLKFQSLLPIVNFQANLLDKGYTFFKNVESGYVRNNNKFGIDIGIPLRLREGRSAYRSARLKIEETGLQISLKKREIENKIRYYFVELAGLQKQFEIAEAAYRNYEALRRAENTRFQAGESSLFLVNNRENKAVEARIKLADVRAKFYQKKIALSWAAGTLL